MAGIRLAKLPERTPVRLTIAIPPDLDAALRAYADAYAAEHGVREPLAELVPAMLAVFLESDREFARQRRTASK